MRRLSAVGLALVLGVACGIRPQSEPIAVPDAVLPAEPAQRSPDVTSPAQPTISVFLVESNRLREVYRHVGSVTLSLAIRELFEGPSEEEVSTGVRTAITPSARVRSAFVAAGAAAIDVTKEFLDITGEEQILAIAQIVYTATAVTGVESVAFRVEGEPIEVPRADGALSSTVTRADYAAMAPGIVT